MALKSYSLRSAAHKHRTNSQYSFDDINLYFDDYSQISLDIRDKEWPKLFKIQIEKKRGNYIYWPEVSEERVYLNFTTSLRQSAKSLEWSFSLVHVISTSEEAFDTIYNWFRKEIAKPQISNFYSNEYINRIVDAFESTRVPLIKDIPVNTTVLWINAEDDLKEACCDGAIIRQVTSQDKDYQCCINKARVYLIENIKFDRNSVDYIQPPSELQRYKWVSSNDVMRLLTVEEAEINDSYSRNGMMYFAMKFDKSQTQLRNFMALDKKCCEQIFSVLSVGIKSLMTIHNVGKTKRFSYIIPLYQGKYSVKRHCKNEFNIPLLDWKQHSHISTLSLDTLKHSLLYGPEATESVITIQNDDGKEEVAFTLLFQHSSLKISEIDDDRARIYGFCHLVKRKPNGIIIGSKSKKKRKVKNDESLEEENDESLEEENVVDESPHDQVIHLVL